MLLLIQSKILLRHLATASTLSSLSHQQCKAYLPVFFFFSLCGKFSRLGVILRSLSVQEFYIFLLFKYSFTVRHELLQNERLCSVHGCRCPCVVGVLSLQWDIPTCKQCWFSHVYLHPKYTLFRWPKMAALMYRNKIFSASL